MKKILFTVFIMSFFILNVTASSKKVEELRQFSSQDMLDKYYGNDSNDDLSKWNDTKISLLTVSKEDPVYSWFGHAAIVVEKPSEPSIMYDYGRFSYGDGFYWNFLFGRLFYSCGTGYSDLEYDYYSQIKRSARKIELNLDAKQKRDIATFLETNCSDGLNTYLYDYFTDNCATRLRDIINQATDGRFKLWAQTKNGYSFREQISMILCNCVPMQWLLDFLLSGRIDKNATLWDEMFLPKNLAQAVLSFEDLAKSDQYAVDSREEDTRPLDAEEPTSYVLLCFMLSVAFSLLLFITRNTVKPLYCAISFSFNFVFGLLGTLLLFFMLFTDHSFTYWNENILLINPALLVAAFMSFNISKHGKKIVAIYSILCTLTVLLAVLKLGIPNVFIQKNLPQIATVLPVYITNITIIKSTV